MPLKKYKPTTPGRRQMSVSTFEEITKTEPEKSLLEPLKKKSGRNFKGRMTVRHKGGRHKRRYRVIDFKRDKEGVPGRVDGIEYDPNRSANIALIVYADGDKRYVLCPNNLKVGDYIMAGKDAEVKVGNSKKLKDMPLGTTIHNIELTPGKGGQLARSAGTGARLRAKEGNYAHIQLPSGEVRLVHLDCKATIGQVGNLDHENIAIGKAGRNRWLGVRPTTRGVATNPADHPHGGGEGKTPTGRIPKTPWGKDAHGRKTRKKKASDRLIIKRRKKKKK